jgi:Flp pilus assembly protein TadG
MIGFMKRLWRDKRGNALLIAGACLPMVVGAAGLATDTIQWSLWKRQLQKAADSAAIAAVYAKIAEQDVPVAVNYDIDKGNNFVRVGQTVTAKKYQLLNAPVVGYPANGTDWSNGVSVQLQVQKALGFTSLFLPTPPIITANATAAAVVSGEYCAQAQINTNATGITAGGNATVDLGCGMITNSTSMDAAVAFGSSSVKASPVAAVGGLDTTDNWASGTTLLPFTLAQPDPFADVPAPAIPTPCNDKFDDKPSDNQTWPAVAPASGTVCVSSWKSQGTVNLQPNTTYIITGDMVANSGAVVNCSGCTFVLTNDTPSQTGTVTFNGGAQFNLTPPDTGIYKGILFYQNRGASSSGLSKILGNSSSMFKGAFYFPHSEVEFTGTAGVTFDCLKLVSWKLTFSGNSSIKNNCPKGYYGTKFMGRHVRLVY